MAKQSTSDDNSNEPLLDPKLLEAFRAGMATESNRVIIAGYKEICARFSADLKRALENYNIQRLRELVRIALLHEVCLSGWCDATLPYAADSHLLILRDYWAETADDIVAALKRGLLPPDEDEDPSEAWKRK